MTDASPLARMKERLKAGTKNIRVIDWPGGSGEQVGLRPLNGSTMQHCELQALKLVDRIPASDHVRVIFLDMYDRELGWQMLACGLVDPESGAPFTTSVDELKQLCDVPEAEQLVEQLVAWTIEVNDPKELEGDLTEQATALGKASPSVTSSSGTSESEPAPSSDSQPPTARTDSSSTSTPAPSDSLPSQPRPPAFARRDLATMPRSSSGRGSSTPGS